jgi:CRISPR-associated protein Csm1
MNQTEKQREQIQKLELLYLSALLHHIPHEKIVAKVSSIISIHPQFSFILNLADKYVLTESGEIAPSHFLTVASPFENLNSEKEWPNFKYAFPQTRLSLGKECFPVPKTSVSNNSNALWEDFTEYVRQYNLANPVEARKNGKAVLYELSQVATSIPNPGTVNPTVSWYDYAKMKAGIAVCLAEYLDWEDKAITHEEEPILIIRADISGIQNFLYDIASKQASKNLKGRSFYIQLLSDAILRKVLKELNLFEGNVMYSSGGNFFILAPNTEEVRNKLSDLEKEITGALFGIHGTRLAVVMGYEKVKQAEIFQGKINHSISRLFREQIDRKKKQKFLTVLTGEKGYEGFFEPIDEGGETITDAVTGEEVDLSNAYSIAEGALPELLLDKKKILENEGASIISDATAKQIFLGYQLKDIAYIIVTDSPLKIRNERLNRENRFEPAKLGIIYYTIKAGDESTFEEALTSAPPLDIWCINNSLVKEWNNIPVQPFLYGGNGIPVLSQEELDELKKESPGEYIDRKASTPKYFHEMSGKGRFKRLGVLRMDIDNLGKLFKDASTDHLTFAYYASLSRNLDWFFRGYINTIWESDEAFKSNTQIIYSGGDDLFVVGRWDLMIDFAEKINTSFAEFTCRQPDSKILSLSGGVAIVTHKFPIMKAAAFSADAEKAAKGHKLDGESDFSFSKNSITLFGIPLHWDTEYELVKVLKEELVRYVESENNPKGLPKSVLGKIQAYSGMARKYQADYNRMSLLENGIKASPPIPKWVWHVVYDFSRMIDRVKGADRLFARKIRDKIDENLKLYLKNKADIAVKMKNAIFTNSWENNSIQSSYHFIELLSVAAKWAELEIRNCQSVKKV